MSRCTPYGNSETFARCIYPSGTPKEQTRDSRGKPLPAIFKIVDPLSGEVVPIGERGEIAVKGPTLMLGYLGKPLDETLDGEGFCVTGDGGYVDEAGRLYWVGRLNDIIKTAARRVAIDSVLMSIPGVRVQTIGRAP